MSNEFSFHKAQQLPKISYIQATPAGLILITHFFAKFDSMKRKNDSMSKQNPGDSQEIIALKKKIVDLLKSHENQQVLIDFKIKMIELAEKEYQIDIRKKFTPK